MILLYSLTGKNRFTVYCIDFMPNKNDIRVTDQTHVPSLNCNSNTFRSLKLTYLSWVEVKSNFSPTNHDATHHCPLVTSSKTVFTFLLSAFLYILPISYQLAISFFPEY